LLNETVFYYLANNQKLRREKNYYQDCVRSQHGYQKRHCMIFLSSKEKPFVCTPTLFSVLEHFDYVTIMLTIDALFLDMDIPKFKKCFIQYMLLPIMRVKAVQ